MSGLEALAHKEYPGRFIVLGRDETNEWNVVVYGITGRSKESKERMLVHGERGTIRVEPLDRRGDGWHAALLYYPAIVSNEKGIVVSNGAQTELLYSELSMGRHKTDAERLLRDAFSTPKHRYVFHDGHWQWIDITKAEPDRYTTPRISGCIIGDSMATGIAYKEGTVDLSGFAAYEPVPGFGQLITTYDGANREPLPTGRGENWCVHLDGDFRAVAENVYMALRPEHRVGVATVFVPKAVGHGEPLVAIVNRHEMGA